MSETESQAIPETAAIAHVAAESAAESTPTVASEASEAVSSVEVNTPVTAETNATAEAKEAPTRPRKKRNKRGKTNKAKAEGAEPSKDKKREKKTDPNWVSYQPADILKRMQNKRSLWEAYQEDARALALQIQQWGLGTSLAILLAQTQSKRKRRLYWDLSKWMLKERKLKGKNARSLIESILYGDAFYLLRATEASLGFLEEILFLGQQKAYQPISAQEKSAEKQTDRGIAPTEPPHLPEMAATPTEEMPTSVETTPTAEALPVEAVPEVEGPKDTEANTDVNTETPPDQNDENRSAPVHA